MPKLAKKRQPERPAKKSSGRQADAPFREAVSAVHVHLEMAKQILRNAFGKRRRPER
jgi:hypothetical protein